MLKKALDIYEAKAREFVLAAIRVRRELLKVISPHIQDIQCAIGIGPIFSFKSKTQEQLAADLSPADFYRIERNDLTWILDDILNLNRSVAGILIWHFDAPFGLYLENSKVKELKASFDSALQE